MFDIVCIFLLYLIQGAIQGVVFGTFPLLFRRNPAATDVHQSQLSVIAYPFSLKFLIAPLVDGVYIARIGRRETWLLPLQLFCAVALGWLSLNIKPMMEASPPEVASLALVLFGLVAATAAGDIATDAWAAGRMSDSRASLCQSLGLSIGSEGSVTVFFLLMGRELVDLPGLLRLMSTLGFAVFGIFVLRMGRGQSQAAEAAKEAEDDEEVGVLDVLRRIASLVRGSANLRWYVAFALLVPMLGGHGSVMAVRYQELGFSPELFAEYDLYLLPVSFATMWLGGKISNTRRLLTVNSWIYVAQVFLSIAQLVHFWKCQEKADSAVSDPILKFGYIVLNQVGAAFGTVQFVVRVAFYNRLSQKHLAIAGTVITFLASTGNMGGTLPSTWAPLMVDRFGIDATAAFCLTSGVCVLAFFWPKLQRLEAEL